MTDKERIESSLQLVRIAVTKYRPPKGLNQDDLFSCGQVALVEAAARWDESTGVPWKSYAYRGIKLAISNLVKGHRSMGNLQPEIDGETLAPPVDRRQAEPGAIVAARERLKVGQLMERMPTPEVVSKRAVQLRDAMFDAVEEDDVRAIMKGMVEKAKNGDYRAARFVADMVSSGTRTPTHQKIIVFGGDPREVTD